MSIGNSATLQIGIEIKDDGTYALKKFRTETDRTTRDGKRSFKDMGRGVDDFNRSLSSSLTSMLKIGSGVGGFLAVRSAIRGLISTGKEWVQLAGIQESAEKNLETVLKATGHAAGYNLDQLKAMASGMQDVTTVGDEVILNAQAMLATFKNVRGEGFERATMAALDMSQVMGQDLKSSIVQIGKALNDPIQGMTALSRVGVTFTEQQKDQIKMLQDSGQAIDAQNIILKELETQFGGTAKAARETFAGITKAVANTRDDLKEDLGEVIGKNEEVIEAFQDLDIWIKQNAPLMAENFSNAIGPIMTGMINMAKAVGKVTSFSLKVLADAQKRAREGHYEFIGSVEKDTLATGGQIASIIKDGAEELERNLKELADQARVENEDLTKDISDDTKYMFDRMKREGELYYEEQEDMNASLIAITRYTTNKMIDAAIQARWKTANAWRDGFEQIGADQKTLFDAWKDAWADAIQSPETTYEVVKDLTVDFVRGVSRLLGDGISAAFRGDLEDLKGIAKLGLEDLGRYIGQISGSIFGPVGATIGGAIGQGIGEAIGNAIWGESTKYAEVGAAIAKWTTEGFIVNFTPTGSDQDEWGSRLSKQLNDSLASYMTPFNETFLQAIEINSIPGIDSALNDFQTKFAAVYNSGFEGFSISEKGNWQEDFENIMAHIQGQWDAGVREMLNTVGFESYEQFQAYVEKMNAMIQASAGTIGSAFREGLDSGEFSAFEAALYDSVYNQILDAMISALMQSELFRQALVPFYQSMEDAMNSLYDPVAFQQKMTDAVGVLQAGVGALQPQFEAMNQTVAAVKSMLGIGAERGSTDVPSLDVGTYSVSDAGLAYLHKYEMVIPAKVAGSFQEWLKRFAKDQDGESFSYDAPGNYIAMPSLADILGSKNAIGGLATDGLPGWLGGGLTGLANYGVGQQTGIRGRWGDVGGFLGGLIGNLVPPFPLSMMAGMVTGPLGMLAGDALGDLFGLRGTEELRDFFESNFGYFGGRREFASSLYDRRGTSSNALQGAEWGAQTAGIVGDWLKDNQKDLERLGIDVEKDIKQMTADILGLAGWTKDEIDVAFDIEARSFTETADKFGSLVDQATNDFGKRGVAAIDNVSYGFDGFSLAAVDAFDSMTKGVADLEGFIDDTVSVAIGRANDAAEAASTAAGNANDAADNANESAATAAGSGGDRIGTIDPHTGEFEPGRIGSDDGQGGFAEGSIGSMGGNDDEGYSSDVDNESRGAPGYSYARGSWYTPQGRHYIHPGEIIIDRPRSDALRSGKAAVIDTETLSLLRAVVAQGGGSPGPASAAPAEVRIYFNDPELKKLIRVEADNVRVSTGRRNMGNRKAYL